MPLQIPTTIGTSLHGRVKPHAHAHSKTPAAMCGVRTSGFTLCATVGYAGDVFISESSLHITAQLILQCIKHFYIMYISANLVTRKRIQRIHHSVLKTPKSSNGRLLRWQILSVISVDESGELARSRTGCSQNFLLETPDDVQQRPDSESGTFIWVLEKNPDQE